MTLERVNDIYCSGTDLQYGAAAGIRGCHRLETYPETRDRFQQEINQIKEKFIEAENLTKELQKKLEGLLNP